MESFAPGYLEELGLGYAALWSAIRGLIYTSVTAFWSVGSIPRFQRLGTVAQAMGGLMHTIGLPDREPLKIGGNAASIPPG